MNDDSIKRSDAIKAIKKRKAKIVCNYKSDKWFRQMILEVEAIPSADRPQGAWEFIGDNMFRCTSCGETYSTYQFENLRTRITDPHPLFPRGCPHCGERMKVAYDAGNRAV